MRSCIIY